MSAFVSILMGSDSDFPLVKNTIDILKEFGVKYEVKVASAHRTPDIVTAYVQDAQDRGAMVFICAAGLAAHLAGAVAARTVRPVIGIPVDGGALNGVDALYSTVQMPGGIPVATVAIGKPGAKNAAYLAIEILATADKELFDKLVLARAKEVEQIVQKDKKLQESL